MAIVLYCETVVRKIEFQSYNNFHFGTNTLGKDSNPLQATEWIVQRVIFDIDSFAMK